MNVREGNPQRRVGTDRPPVVVYEDVVKDFGGFRALHGVSAQVNAGEVVCLIGPSGSGKSTLLRCTNALEVIQGGRILFDGSPLPAEEKRAKTVRRRMGDGVSEFRAVSAYDGARQRGRRSGDGAWHEKSQSTRGG